MPDGLQMNVILGMEARYMIRWLGLIEVDMKTGVFNTFIFYFHNTLDFIIKPRRLPHILEEDAPMYAPGAA